MSTHYYVTIVIISNVDNRAYDNHLTLTVQEVCLSRKQYSNVYNGDYSR